ncbi:MAG: flagellar motor stator protein MotA [Candidimonas sp.]|nr:MAG: flagellar motor stator protein MotA [Candidimonas sp.]
MLVLIGLVVVVVAVFGSYVAGDGHVWVLWQPMEILLIAGAAVGSFVVGNNRSSLRLLRKNLPGIFRRTPYNKTLYMDLMACMYSLLTVAKKEGVRAIEKHIEDTASSSIFTQYPEILSDKILIDFLVDYLRLMVSGYMSPYEIETLMDEELETVRYETQVPVHALRTTADSLPAFGIVAAVMGVIKALAAVDQPPAVLADLISKAMVGTFAGILLAYGVGFPFAEAMDRRGSESVKTLECIKVTLLAYLNGYPPQIAVEFGRKVLFDVVRPSFLELEEHVRGTRAKDRGKA